MNRRHRTVLTATVAGLTVLVFGCSGKGTEVTQAPAFCTSAASGEPRIEQFTPTVGLEGNAVMIQGQNLRGAMLVSIADLPAIASTISVASNCVINVQVPSPAGQPRLGSVTVITPLGTGVSTSRFFIATGLPVVSTISPSFGPSGATLSVTGANLFSASLVEVGGASAAPTIAGQTLVVALVSSGAASGGPVRVRTPVGSALSSTRFVLLTDFAVLASSGTPIPSTRFSLATINGLASVWFVDRATGRNYLARLESDGTLTSFGSPGGLVLNGAVALNSLGSAWVGAGRSLAVLSSLNGSLASLTSITLASGANQAGRPAVDSLGSVWFTDASGTVWALAPGTGSSALTSYTAPWAASQSGGRGLLLTNLGSAWTAVGSVLGLLASTATTLTSLSLWNGASPLDLAVDSLGSVWFTDQTTPGVLGVRYATGGVVSVALWNGALVSDLAIDSARTVWFTDGRGSSIGRFSTDGTLTSYATPSAGTVPGSLAADRLGSVWYTQLASIGRLSP